MRDEYVDRLNRLLTLTFSKSIDKNWTNKIRAEIRELKREYAQNSSFLNNLYQVVIRTDENSVKLLRILIESEISKIRLSSKYEGSKYQQSRDYNDILSKSIQYVKGVGPVLFERFKKKGILTIRDALFFFPRDYEDRRNLTPISHIEIGGNVTVTGKVLCFGQTTKTFTMTIGDRTGFLDLVWFNIQPYYMNYLTTKFKPNTSVIVSGRASLFRGNIQINHPVIKEASSLEDDLFFKRIIPIYSSIEGISEGLLVKIMKYIVDEYSKYIVDPLPTYLQKRHNLIPLPDAIREIHFPPNDVDFNELNSNIWKPKRRIIFDELFSLEILLALRQHRYKGERGFPHKISDNDIDDAIKYLPYSLTRSQNTVLMEIIRDLKSDRQMNRILIGDVGSGKTAVAMVSSYLVAKNGTQVAILVPTEILAKQHYNNFCMVFSNIKDRIALLTGSVKGTERSRILGDIKLGFKNIIIGTHALLEDNIDFKNLTFVIIDEQHQFGINQRARMKSKGINPDLLMMSATPIPRTLAISLYGDLDISMIKELPPGRKNIITRVVRGESVEQLYLNIRRQVLNNEDQCYIVYPLISESESLDLKSAEEMYVHLKDTYFKDIPMGLIHGRMKEEEKNETMSDFKSGKLKILISTTVIEVGVDVPTASIIVIEHAERFGLSQLHQLRGRVGRGSKESVCYLVAYNWLSNNAYERLKIMETTSNGFKIAEEDLRIRGPGELAGTRQSGLPDFHMSNLIRDADVLEEARNAAFEIIKNDPHLLNEEHMALRTIISDKEKELELITTS